jgi:hypothetical protein
MRTQEDDLTGARLPKKGGRAKTKTKWREDVLCWVSNGAKAVPGDARVLQTDCGKQLCDKY